jgi:hypothetical protein
MGSGTLTRKGDPTTAVSDVEKKSKRYRDALKYSQSPEWKAREKAIDEKYERLRQPSWGGPDDPY